MTDQKYKLSDRLRPGVECAPWVIDEVRKMEAERDALLARIDEAPKVIIRHVAGEPMSMRGYHSGTEDLHGKRVALVPLGDDE